MTQHVPLTDRDEDLVYCKQAMLRMVAYLRCHGALFLSELQAELNDVELGGDRVDELAITNLQSLIKVCKED